MGAEQVVELFYAGDILKAPNPDEFRRQKVKEYRDRYSNAMGIASETTQVHDIIQPKDTRRCLIKSLELLGSKEMMLRPKKHGNIPL
jgi:acetyl-CoA carboxylase carboxyltransferase component